MLKYISKRVLILIPVLLGVSFLVFAILAMMPAALYFGTLLLGPVALLRYLYPLLLCQPLFWGMCFKVTYVKIDRNEKAKKPSKAD